MSTSSERPSAANVLDFKSSPPSSFPRAHATETASRSGDRSTGRTCVVVLGMHRSGTSALTRVISLLGASLPKNMMPPAAQNNALGFWEPARLVALHNELLSEAGSSWDDWRRLDLGGRLPAARLAHYKIAIAGELSEAYDESPLFVLKDPRICRFFPLYREILNDMGIAVRIVVPLRDPAAVTASLRARDGIPEAVGQLYWLRHMLDAEANTRGVQRAFVAYESLLADWRRAIAPLTSGLGVDWPRGPEQAAGDIQAFISPEHDHHPRPVSSPFGGSEADWTSRCYSAVQRLGLDEPRAITELDELRAEFEPMAAVFGPTLEAERSGRHYALAAERARVDEMLQTLRSEATAETERLGAAWLAACRACDEALAAQRSQAAELTALRAEAATARDEAGRLSAALAEQRIASDAASAAARADAERALAAVRDENARACEAFRRELAAQRAEAEAATAAGAQALRGNEYRVNSLMHQTGKLHRELAAFSRLRRWLNAIHHLSLQTVGRSLVLKPTNDLSVVEEDATGATWRITGGDPYFDMDWGVAAPLPPGHYRLTIHADASGRTVRRAQLYIDTGSGYTEAESLHLVFFATAADRWHTTFVLPRGAHALRLDPSTDSPTVRVGAVRLRRVPRLSRAVGLVAEIVSTNRRHPLRLLTIPPTALLRFLRGGRESLVRFLREAADRPAARPATFWEARPVRLKTTGARHMARRPPTIAVHAHVFYVDMLDEVAACIAAIPHPATVCVSTTTADDAAVTAARLRALPHVARLDVRVVPNRGRDIGPMLVDFGPTLAESDLVAHLHTKRSPHNLDLRGWRTYLFDAAFGSQDVVRTILERFATRRDLGMLFPATYLPVRPFMRIGANGPAIEGLLERLGDARVTAAVRDDFFPAGSVFWCRGSVIRRLVDLGLTTDDFEPEEGQVDGTLAHALERILPAVAAIEGQVAEEYVLDDRKVGESRPDRIADVTDHLFLDHDLGGGTKVFTNHTVRNLLDAGQTVQRIIFDAHNDRYVLQSADETDGAVVCFDGLDAVLTWYRARPVRRIVVNSLVGFPSPDACVVFVEKLKRLQQSTVVYHTHDFYSICPSQHLLDGDNRYCGVPTDLAVCSACAAANSHMWHFRGRDFDIARWRETFQRLMDACDEVVVFDESSIEIMRRVFRLSDERLRVRPHDRTAALRPVRPARGGGLHIGLIGTLNHYKGADIANTLARFIADHGLGTPLTLVGSSIIPLADTITPLGPYEIPDLPKLIESHGITVFFICSIAPETFCYTLDEIMAMELPVVSFSLGAQGRRTAAYAHGTTLPPGAPIESVYRTLVAAHERAQGGH